MNNNAFAVFIGIDSYEDSSFLPTLRYAEKDCRDLCATLADDEIGNFHPENTRLLLGKEATTRRVEEFLQAAVLDRNSSDIVLVYFSGHGFLFGDGEFQEAYLGTCDVRAKDLLTNRNAGLRMKFIHEDIFLKSKARQLIFILDCCYSGALIPAAVRATLDRSSARGLIDENFYSSGKGRVALVACPPDALSRESEDLKNGIFTHYLIRGLRSEATEADTGEVTLDSLMAYVRVHTPPEQPPGRYGQDFGRVVLTRPGARRISRQTPEITSGAFEVLPLHNPLEPYHQFIDHLVGELASTSGSGGEIAQRTMEAIRRASSAETVSIVSKSSDGWVVKEHHRLDSSAIEIAVPPFPSAISEQSVFEAAHQGVYYFLDDEKHRTAAIPLAGGWPATELMIVAGLPPSSPLLGEPYGKILSSLYSASKALTSVQADRIEAAILDDLKTAYGFVPIKAYERRFKLFVERLAQMTINFEPVLYLQRDFLGFDSWEGLARDPERMSAPVDLFDAAELWGPRFTIELDQHFVITAARLYRDSYSKILSSREDLKELSVNVYPESLLRTAYRNTIRSVMKEVLPSRKLVLEISEKAPMPFLEPARSTRMQIDDFKGHLTGYVREFGVLFAIDDFGVGHSSVSRLARLDPEYIKIDRDALLHQYGNAVINFVRDIATQNRLRPPKIVVEGFDTSSLLSLNELYRMKVEYVQGHLIGRAAQDLYALDLDLREELRALMMGSALDSDFV